MSVSVVPHDPRWAELYRSESGLVAEALGRAIVSIHHIGSTSIPGIHAKPVIDMLAQAASLDEVDASSQAMESLGYEALGEYGLAGRRYFRKDDTSGIRTHQVHVFLAGSPDIERHLAFRDYLRAHPDRARAYSDLKRELARKHPDDMQAYMDGKDPFIKEAQKEAMVWRSSGKAVVLFDFGDVIADFDPSFRAAELARLTRLTPDEVLARLSTDDFWVETDRGIWSGPEMERRINELLESDFSHDELLRLQAAAFTLRPEMIAIAAAVSARGRTGILTNNAPLLLEAFPVHFPEVARLFDPLLFSFQFGHVKPEPELYEAVRDRLGVPPEEILFVDDNPANVAAARASGWDAVRFETVPLLREALAQRGILPS